MTTEIKQKWIVPKYNLIITPDSKVLTSDLIECKEELYQGRLVFRLPKSSKRISRKFINNNCIRHDKIIQDFFPF